MSRGQLPVDTSIFFRLVRVVNLTARPFHEGVGKQHGLNINEWRTMVALASHPGAAATEVADYTGLDKMTVSRALAGLQRQGRVQRHRDPADQRRSVLTLSPQGKRLFARIGVAAQARERQLFAALSSTELAQLNTALDKLLAGLDGAPVGADGLSFAGAAPLKRERAR